MLPMSENFEKRNLWTWYVAGFLYRFNIMVRSSNFFYGYYYEVDRKVQHLQRNVIQLCSSSVKTNAIYNNKILLYIKINIFMIIFFYDNDDNNNINYYYFFKYLKIKIIYVCSFK
jgi:hypothetical protein